MFHVNHAVKVPKYRSVVVASPDTDVFVCSIHHFNQLVYFDLNAFWFVSGRSNSTTVVPIHEWVDQVSADVIDILPTIHALTGCDTMSKIGTKTAALKTAQEYGHELLCFFGKRELTDKMIDDADKFLL